MGRKVSKKKVVVEIEGKEYPCFQTMGALMLLEQETGKRDVQECKTLCDLMTFLWACCKSACRREGIPFPYGVDDFADNLSPEDLAAWVLAMQGDAVCSAYRDESDLREHGAWAVSALRHRASDVVLRGVAGVSYDVGEEEDERDEERAERGLSEERRAVCPRDEGGQEYGEGDEGYESRPRGCRAQRVLLVLSLCACPELNVDFVLFPCHAAKVVKISKRNERLCRR